MSDHLKAFLSEWLAWVDAGAPKEGPFSRHYGLCSNLDDWMWGEQLKGGERYQLECELKAMFAADGFDRDYPFGGFQAYRDDLYADTSHQNPARIAWVRSKVAQFAAA